MTNRQYSRCRVIAQSAWKKSVASIVAAWVCRNCRQVASVCRCGAGGIQPAAQREQDGEEPNRPTGMSGASVRRAVRRPIMDKRARIGKASGYTHRSFRPDAVRYVYVDTAIHRSAVTHRDAQRDREETARRTAFPQPRGRFAGGGRCWIEPTKAEPTVYRPLLRTTLHSHLPAQTRPDWPDCDGAVRYMYVAMGCRAAHRTDSRVQNRFSPGRSGPFVGAAPSGWPRPVPR